MVAVIVYLFPTRSNAYFSYFSCFFLFFRHVANFRSAECPFLSIAETLLVLRDLVRRNVLWEAVVPDARCVSSVFVNPFHVFVARTTLSIRTVHVSECVIPGPHVFYGPYCTTVADLLFLMSSHPRIVCRIIERVHRPLEFLGFGM